MTSEQFFQGFLASLRLLGEDHLETAADAHHRRFRRVVRALEAAQRKHEAGAADMPDVLVPNAVTGRFREFDEAIVSLQKGRLLGAQNPLYRRVDLAVSPENARRILELYSAEHRELFKQLAAVYRDGDQVAA